MFGKHGSNRISGKIKRIMAGFLCFVMMASYMPAAVYASEAEPAEGQIVESAENAVTDQAPVTAEEAVIEEEAAPEKSADAEETETALETVADEHEDLSNPDQTRTDFTVTTNVVGGALGNAIAVFYGDGTVQDGETTYVASDVCELNITIDPYQYWAIDGVSVTIGGTAAYIAKNDGKPYPKGAYLISNSEGSTSAIEGDVVITVETHAYPEGTHFVSFDTGYYHEHIGCVPEGSEFIPSNPWEGGVYVYDGASLSFHLNAENGYVITNVSQGYDGDDMRATNGPVHTGRSIEYGVYTTGPITEDTVICVQSEREDIHFVKFDTGSSTEIGCVPDGGDYIPTNPWQGGVYVYDGAKLYFHFNVNEGTGITKVTQGKGGKELLSSSVASYDPDKELITTGRYKTEAITSDTAIVVTSATKALHYVNFYTGENSAQIGCVPDEGDFVAPKVWNGGVYVYDGGTFSFHFNVNNGYKITKVTQQKAGNELAADGVELTSSASDVVMGTYTYKGKYTTKVVSEETTIFVSSEAVAGDANILQWKHKEGDDNGPFKGTIVRGADSATGVIPEGVKEIEVNISTEKNSNKESDDNKIYGIRSVTATIGGVEADVEFLEPQGKKDINIPDGVYRIKKKNDDTAIGNAAVVITVETKRVHFVGFHTGSSNHVGCLPVPVLEVEGHEVRSDYIGTSPWEGGVYVFHGGEFPFRYTLTDGALVTKVRQGGGEDSPVLNPVGENVLREDEKTGRQWIETGLYTTGPITTRTYLCSDHYMQHGLVLNNGEVEYIFPDDYQNNPDAPVVKDLDGKYYLNQDADSFKFKLQPEDDSFRVATATYRVINFYDDEEEVQQYEQAYGYPGTTKLVPDNDGYYTVEIPKTSDNRMLLGVELNVGLEQLATIGIAFEDEHENDMEGRLFDVSVRIGSKLYPVTYDTVDEYYLAEVPANSTVTVCLTSKDDLWTVSSVFPEDESKNSGKTQNASKNGEYVLTVADEACLTATITPVTKVQVAVKGDDNKYALLDPVKNAYTLNASDTFKAYVVSGSEYYNNVLLPVPVNATFWNGNKQIVDDDANDGVLITSGATLNLKKLSLKAKVDNKAYTATLNFVNNPTKVTITSPKVGPQTEYAIVVPYGEKATIKVSIDGDLKGVTAWFAEVSEFDGNWQPTGFTQLVNVASIGTFDGKTVTIDPKKAKTVCPEIYRPNGNTELIFYNAQNEKIGAGMEGLNSLIFSAPAIAGQPAPTIKANPSLSTNRMIGLSLTLPKGVKAATGMYYMIEASVAPYEKKDEDKHERWIDGQKYEYYDRLAYYDDNNDRVVYVFKENAVGFVPATEKACLLPVTNDTGNSEDGWKVDYSVKATLVYADPDNGYAITSFDEKEQKTLSTEAMILSTKDSAYETKLGLTKKLPAKIYNTQNNIPVAMPKWSKNTTVQALDSVELLNEYGNVKGHWSRWDQAGDNERLSVDEESGLITLDTVWMDGTQRRHLEAGKYTLVAYAIGGPGKAAQATLPVTLLESIHSLRVSAPMQVQKAFNKAATVKADVAYNVSDWENAPATKSVTWSVVQLVTPATDTDPAVYREIPEDSPLFGNITVKNGTATLNAKLLVNLAKYTPGDYQFVIKATAADYAGNTAEDYSDPIQITTDAQIPTEIQFVWETRDENDNLLREDYSEITEENIAIRDAAAKRKDPYVEPFYSNAIQHAHVRVLNQFGEQIEANLKLSGVTMNQWGELILSKPGKVSVTATSADGSNKSKKIQFTIANGDVRFKPNVLIQDSSRDIDFDASFINIADGKNRWNSAGLKACENIFPSSRYIYVHVAGVRFADVAGKNRLSPWLLPDYGCNVMFDHGIKVSGGTIKSTTTDMLENYTTYVILPSAPTTEITLTDKTNDKAYGRTKTDYKYTITNTAINTAKAAQITADKTSILNFMYIEKDIYTVESNPNHVEYTIKDPAEVPELCNAVVQVYMDDLSTNAKYNLSKFIGMSDDESDEFFVACNAAFDDLKDGYYAEIEAEVNAMEGLTDPEKAELIAQKKDDKYAWFRENFRRTRENLGIFIDVNGGKFDIDFFRENKETRKVNNVDTDFYYWEFFETPAGTYDFYATYGYLDGNDQFHPLNAPTKLSVKLAPAKKPSVNLKKATFEIDFDNDQDVYCSKIEVPNVNDGVGIRSFYQTVSTNSNGTTNRFADLFGICPAEYADERELMDEEALLIVQRDPDERIPIGSGKNLCYAHVTNWLDLYALKEGQFTSKDDKPEEYNNGEGSKLLGKAADQKKAYQNWIKANCTGMLRMRAVGYDGRDYETEVKITVDIEEFINDTDN